jgi:paraquat-inducible protein B
LNATHPLTASHAHVRYPQAKITRRAALSFIWTVPAVAAVVAAVLIIQNLQKFGPSLTIQFANASGLDANQTVIRYRGIRVGSVSSIQLSPDLQHVEVRARLYRSAAALAREGSVFWIVRPEVGTAGIHALETIVSGPYIEALPGDPQGRTQNRFIGAGEAPIVKEPGGGKEFILRAAQIRSLGADSPVYYRGFQAGRVLYLELNHDARTVNIHLVLKPNFAPLVRSNTVWWNAGGIDINWHLLSGLNMSAENMRSLVTGGIAFATPDAPDGEAPDGATFTLAERPDEKWLGWSPHLELTNSAIATQGASSGIQVEGVNPAPKQQ